MKRKGERNTESGILGSHTSLLGLFRVSSRVTLYLYLPWDLPLRVGIASSIATNSSPQRSGYSARSTKLLNSFFGLFRKEASG